jgi:hypothetical protein
MALTWTNRISKRLNYKFGKFSGTINRPHTRFEREYIFASQNKAHKSFNVQVDTLTGMRGVSFKMTYYLKIAVRSNFTLPI